MPVHAHLAILAGMSKLLKTLTVATFLVLLAGCGAKGPLVLPDRTAPDQVPDEQPADEADGDVDDQPQQDAAEAVPAKPDANG